jgi:hypothetical protein
MAEQTCTIEKVPFEECGNEAETPADPCFDGMCVELRDGKLCPVENVRSPWSLTESSEDACLVDSYLNEQLNIAGADINVHKLLGIHEQGKLIDLTGDGNPISSGSHPNFPMSNAFDLFTTEWRSLHVGQEVLTKTFLGYDFGEIKLDNGRVRYGIETFVKHDISTVKIKQGCDSINRVTKVRLERSHDGVRWFGAGISTVDDCDGIVTLSFAASVPSRYWRLRPLEFNGSTTDYWAVQALQFIDYEKTSINNIQDKIFMENRDRNYAEFSETVKGSYSPIDSQSFISKFGAANNFGGENYFIELNWSEVVRVLGRPIVIGDILQLPSETQYSADLTPVLKYLTVTDVGWSPTGYSPQWIPLMVRVIAEPSVASPETQDVFGKLTEEYDEMGLADTGDGLNNKKYQDIADVDHTVRAEANTEIPQLGEDAANVQKYSDAVYEWQDAHPNANLAKSDRGRNLWSRDGMPPNGEPFTQGDEFVASPVDGAFID